MPVLLSGGIWFQSTLSSVNIVFGSFGWTSSASEFVPRAQQAGDVERVARVGALDGRVGRDLVAVDPHVGLADDAVDDQLRVLAGAARRLKSVRNHHGTANCGTVSGPIEFM